MNPVIKISEVKIKNQFSDKLKIEGATSKKDAKLAAEEWCDENNCLLKNVVSEELTKDSKKIFLATVSSDDYK